MLFVVAGMILLVYVLINYYIGLRGWQIIGSIIPFLNIRFYWIIFWVLSLSYIVVRLGERYLPVYVTNWLTFLGSYWMAAMLYFVMIFVFIDIIRLIDRYLNLIPSSVKGNKMFMFVFGLGVFSIVAGVLIYGSWNARNPMVRHYDIDIPKSTKGLKEFHVVMVSDVHLGNIIHNGRLVKIVDIINGLNPDIILMAGDVVDEDIGPFVEQKMSETIGKLRSKYGIYAILGNHEYIGGQAEDIIKYLKESGIVVLRDDYVKIADSFYIVGRDDNTKKRFDGVERKDLPALISDLDKSLPIILLDHQPNNIREAQKNGVDLQLSGHTHRGQMFPNNLITKRMYEVDWGYFKNDKFQAIVSCGVGTWGPPLRIGNNPEIVDITIRFQ